jgi:hypothetical protein
MTSSPGLISVFRSFPKELFRVNTGRHIKLRVHKPGRYLYDIVALKGRFVEPKALDPETYVGKSP